MGSPAIQQAPLVGNVFFGQRCREKIAISFSDGLLYRRDTELLCCGLIEPQKSGRRVLDVNRIWEMFQQRLQEVPLLSQRCLSSLALTHIRQDADKVGQVARGIADRGHVVVDSRRCAVLTVREQRSR